MTWSGRCRPGSRFWPNGRCKGWPAARITYWISRYPPSRKVMITAALNQTGGRRRMPLKSWVEAQYLTRKIKVEDEVAGRRRTSRPSSGLCWHDGDGDGVCRSRRCGGFGDCLLPRQQDWRTSARCCGVALRKRSFCRPGRSLGDRDFQAARKRRPVFQPTGGTSASGAPGSLFGETFSGRSGTAWPVAPALSGDRSAQR